jgi:MYXO-CTERM domain-containing protein
MLKRFTIFTAALVLLAGAVPLSANGVHPEKGASGQGLATDAFFEPATPVNGITVTPFDNQGTIFDVLQIPSSFTTGTPFLLTFANIADGYGIFDCDNGTNGFAISADSTPVNIGSTCTAGPAGSNEAFVSFNEVGSTSTITFLGGAGAPPTFYFWTTDGNLTGFAPVSSTGTAPEPGGLLLLASGLAGIALLRRRTVQS